MGVYVCVFLFSVKLQSSIIREMRVNVAEAFFGEGDLLVTVNKTALEILRLMDRLTEQQKVTICRNFIVNHHNNIIINYRYKIVIMYSITNSPSLKSYTVSYVTLYKTTISL